MSARIQILSILLASIVLLHSSEIKASPEDLINGIVRVSVGTGKSGTGFIVRISGRQADIVTAAHVIEGASTIEVTFPGSLDNPMIAATVVMNVDVDIAVIRARQIPSNAIVLSFDPEHQSRLGDEAYLLSFPRFGRNPKVLRGGLAGIEGIHLMFDVRGEETFSGSPLISSNKVIAMVKSKESLLVALPAQIILKALQGWGIIPSAGESLSAPNSASLTGLAAALKAKRYEIHWTGGFAGAAGMMRRSVITSVTVDGDHAEFNYKWNNGLIDIRGVLRGTIADRRFSGTWEELAVGHGPGTFEFEFNEDLSRADGWWKLNGSDERNAWSMHRLD